MFAVTILGNNSATPAYGRFPTSQVVTINEHQILIDCGEGTQMQLSKYKIRKRKINHILISHLHGDHYFGLVGLLTSMGLLGRETDLHLYAPAALEKIIQLQFESSNISMPYTIHFHPLTEEGIIADENKFSIKCFKVKHTIECWGFIIKEKKVPKKLDKEKAVEYNIPAAYYNSLKEGNDYVTKEGTIIKNELVTTPNTPEKTYAFCADTIYFEEMIDKIKNTTLLYHEATYLKDLENKATQYCHSTTVQAATIAKKSNAKKLLIGHFSSRYEVLDDFLTEAKEIFDNTELAIESVTYIV
ncbi:MAG: ribonuclease Z [Chitinophagaceae bacterium]|nr:ribonuclease Z [Chitinophagaceae bacterium]MCW5905322.1 ribonuclease Z [Chitinophagaceae bacterium]